MGLLIENDPTSEPRHGARRGTGAESSSDNELNQFEVHPHRPHINALEPVAIKADCIRNDGHSWRILQG